MRKASSAEPAPASPPAAGQPSVDPGEARRGFSLWLWVAAGFLFLALLWTGMFIAARSADSRSVPLETTGGRP